MKVERLYEIALDLKADFKATKIISITDALVNALQSQVSNPNPEHQRQISTYRDELISALKSSRVNIYPESWTKHLDEMGVRKYLGNALADLIHAIISRNQITTNDALNEISEIKSQLDIVSNSINNLINAFKYFEFEAEALEAGQYEISVSIPREAIHNELGRLGKELSRLERIFGVFTEITTGSRAPFQLRALSTTDPTVFLDSIPAVAAAFSIALERCVALYNGGLKIIISHKELRDNGVPIDKLSGLKERISTTILEGLNEIALEIENEHFVNVPVTRTTELSKELREALKDIAARLDEGYGFDVRGETTEEASDSTPENAEGEHQEKRLDINYQIVSEARRKIRRFKPQPEAILGLPKPSNDDAIE